jgi:hypothetical protein
MNQRAGALTPACRQDAGVEHSVQRLVEAAV